MSAADAKGGDAQPFPWDAALEAGLAHLRLGPREFWTMTPRELGAALGRRQAAAPTRPALAALMARCPDKTAALDKEDAHAGR